LAPDGKRLAVTIRDVATDVWIYDMAGGTPTRLTSGANRNDSPVWMPDGHAMVFAGAGGLAPLPLVFFTRPGEIGAPPAVLWKARPPDTQQVLQLNSVSP